MAFGFGALHPQGMTQEDLARLFNAQLMGIPQGFSGTSPQLVEPQPAPQPQPMFRQPLPPTAPASLPPAPPQAGAPVPRDYVPPPMPSTEPRPLSFGPIARPQPEPAPAPQPQADPPAAPPEEESLLSRMVTGLNKPSVYNMLMGLGQGLMSTPGFGQAAAAGLEKGAALNRQQAVSDLARIEMALKAQKLAKEQQGENMTRAYLLSKGLSPEAASAATANPTVLSSVMGQLNRDPSRVTIGGQIYELRPGERPSDANKLGPAGDGKPRIELRQLNDGRMIAVDLDAVARGEGGVGGAPAPGAAPGAAGVSPGVSVVGAGGTRGEAERQSRKEWIQRNGGDPQDPRNADYIATGQFPKDAQQRLTAPDKKVIQESEDQIVDLNNTIKTLAEARALNNKTYQGRLAGVRGSLGSTLPDAMVPDWIAEPRQATDTAEFGKIMKMEAIEAMSRTLKGATTDRELGQFVEILADPSTPPEVRERTIDRMTRLAEQKRELAQARTDDLRGGTYYKPGSGLSNAPGKQRLRYNPATGNFE